MILKIGASLDDLRRFQQPQVYQDGPQTGVDTYNECMTSKARGTSRNRHGRSIRRQIFGSFIRNQLNQPGSFEQVVSATCDYLRAAWPNELELLNWRVADAPLLGPDDSHVRRWAVRKNTMTIIIFRVPIERLGHHRRTDALHERMHIEEYVFAAAGELLGKDPWELVPERYR